MPYKVYSAEYKIAMIDEFMSIVGKDEIIRHISDSINRLDNLRNILG